uniref:Uncharacterized protein n=1 Tax=Romanomermis culicivorax TaxID=13658 RepID=A0A915ITD6_ROMCU
MASTHELSNNELLETPISDLNITKLLADVATSSLAGPTPASDLTASAMSINKFLKLRLDDITNTMREAVEMTKLKQQPIKPDMEEDIMNISDKTLTDIPKETTVDTKTTMDKTKDLAFSLQHRIGGGNERNGGLFEK